MYSAAQRNAAQRTATQIKGSASAAITTPVKYLVRIMRESRFLNPTKEQRVSVAAENRFPRVGEQ